MKVIHAHQHYRIRGGEDGMVEATLTALRNRGVEARLLERDSRELGRGPFARLGAFVSGIYSLASGRVMRQMIAQDRPDLVHVHNLHPSLSPSVIVASQRAGVPVVMTCHNYRLVCPSGMHMRSGRVCELCLHGREYWCAFKNCKENIGESLGYALRNYVHRRARFYLDHISLFIAVSAFVRQRLIEAGLPEERIVVVPNMVSIPPEGDVTDCVTGRYIAFAGRFNPQKGIGTLLEAARLTGLPVRLAGDASAMPEVAEWARGAIEFTGRLEPDQMKTFYQGARMVVAPSECLEPFGLVAIEAMAYGRPVIASRIGGLTEIVEEGKTGFLFRSGDCAELAAYLQALWADPEMCRRLGQAGRWRVMNEYTEDRYSERLLAVYQKVLGLEPELASESLLGWPQAGSDCA